MAGPRQPVRIAPELFEVLQLCDRWRDGQRRRVRPADRGPDAALVALRDGRTGCRRRRRSTARQGDRWAGRRGGSTPAARTAERLSDGPLSLNAIAKGYIVERACRRRDGRAAGGIRGVLLNVGGDLRVCGAPRSHHQDRRPGRRQRDAPPRSPVSGGSRQGGLHQRELASRVPDRRPMVLAQARPPDGPAGRAGGQRDGHRRSVGRCRCAGHDLQRALARGERRAWPGRYRASSA